MKITLPILSVALSIVVSGCGEKKSAPKVTVPVPVLTAQAVSKTMPVCIDPPPVGHVTPISSVTIRPQISGIISEVHFQEGQEVKKGDLLFTIDPRPAEAALMLAKGITERDSAQLENARIQLDRQQKLFDQKLVSQDVFDTAKAAYQALAGTVAADRAAVATAELNLQYTEIRSPVDGRTGAVLFRAGNVVKSPDDVLARINQLQPIDVSFAVPERYLPEIQRQMARRTLTVSAGFEKLSGAAPQGQLGFVDNSVDTSTGTIQLKATFPNADVKLWPGQFVQLRVQLDELNDAVTVPSQAVQMGQNGQFVFVVKKDKTVELRTVKTAVTVGGETAIESGLSQGETVVTDGHLRLAPGATVEVKSK